MGFMEQLKRFNETGLNVYSILVADCVNDIFGDIQGGVYYTDADKEIICNYVYDWILNTTATPDEVASILKQLLVDNEITIKDIAEDNPLVRDKVNNRF